MTAPADQSDRPPKGPPPGWVYTPRDAPPPADQAACTPDDADRILYQDGAGAHRQSVLDEARELCQSCPVQTECLDYALTADERHGVWGGLSANERGELHQRLKLRSRRPSRPESIPHVVGADTHDHRCGTRKGYLAHRRRGENACRPCLDANAAYWREQPAAGKRGQRLPRSEIVGERRAG